MASPRAPHVVHLELHTGSAEDARAFYAGLCGWRSEHVWTGAGCYLALDLGGGADGGAGREGRSEPLGGGIVEGGLEHALWLPYVEVERIGPATERAAALGARVLLAPREGPAGWRSVVAAPAAGELALWQPKR